MNIAKIEPIAVSLPMTKPVVMAGEEVRRADNMLVRLEADDGSIGWGEAASAPTMTGETVAGMIAAVQYLSPALIGRAADDIAGAFVAMDGRMYGNHGAKAAIEIALHDLVGRATGTPAHALLGARCRDCVALLAVVGGGDLAGDLDDAVKKKETGYTVFKVKVGLGTPTEDAARTRRICELLGGGLLISADANQGFGRLEAVAFVRAVAGCGLGFFEQPVAADDLDGMAMVAAATDIAIGADEGIHTLADIFRHHSAKAARGVSLKAIKLGGLRALVEAAKMCDQLGMLINVSCKTGESSIAGAAALHAAAVAPQIAWGLTLTNAGLAVDVTPHPLRFDRGSVGVLDRPGLGIDVDEACVGRHRVNIVTGY